jgi:uncharacterized membrane protein YqhA
MTGNNNEVKSVAETTKRPFKSYRLRGAYEKPWLKDKDVHKTRRNDIIIMVFLAVGFALAAVVIVVMVLPYREANVSKHPLHTSRALDSVLTADVL